MKRNIIATKGAKLFYTAYQSKVAWQVGSATNQTQTMTRRSTTDAFITKVKYSMATVGYNQ